METAEGKNFTIEITTDGTAGPIHVNYKETTDGIPYYEFEFKGQKIQLRKDNKWEQIWGDLSPEMTDQIGAAIDQKK